MQFVILEWDERALRRHTAEAATGGSSSSPGLLDSTVQKALALQKKLEETEAALAREGLSKKERNRYESLLRFFTVSFSMP